MSGRRVSPIAASGDTTASPVVAGTTGAGCGSAAGGWASWACNTRLRVSTASCASVASAASLAAASMRSTRPGAAGTAGLATAAPDNAALSEVMLADSMRWEAIFSASPSRTVFADGRRGTGLSIAKAGELDIVYPHATNAFALHQPPSVGPRPPAPQ